MPETFYQQTTSTPVTPFDVSLRPPVFSEFIGQEKVKERLLLMLAAAKHRGDVLDHVLLSGPPGLGKTTLANLLARAAGSQLHTTSGPQIEKAGDLAGILTNIQRGDVLFIDEIHRLHPAIEEYLYPAMEDFRLDIIIDSGPAARSIQINLPRFTLVGATTRSGMLTAPLRSRFGLPPRGGHPTRRCPRSRLPVPRHPARRQRPAALGPRLRPSPRQRPNRPVHRRCRPRHDRNRRPGPR